MPKKRSFLERLTGSIAWSDELEPAVEEVPEPVASGKPEWLAQVEEEGELSVDVYQTSSEIIIKAMVSGVRPEDLGIEITREMVTIKGKREESREISGEDYFQKELYWGAFSRTILLPAEVEADEADAVIKHGLLTLRLPKIDKDRRHNLKVKVI